MNPLLRAILASVGVLVLVAIAWNAAQTLYFAPRSELLERISTARGLRDQFREEDSKLTMMLDKLQAYADRSLGTSREEVDAALRERLNRIKEEIGLRDAAVTTGQFRLVQSPAQRSLNRRNPFRNDPDLAELQGSISGKGSLEDVMRLLHRIEAEPWMKRIDSYSLDPNKEGTDFSVVVRLTTMFLPDMVPEHQVEPVAYDDDAFGPYLAFAATEPFRLPPPPSPAQPAVAQVPHQPEAQAPPPPAQPRFSYREWVLTALTLGRNGYEAWVVNRKSNESRVLGVGDVLKDMAFVSASADGAEFELGDKRFLIAVGETLADRSPLSR